MTNTCEMSPAGNVITCEGRLAYAFGLTKASVIKGEVDMTRAKYQGSLVFPKGSDLTLLNEAIEAAAVDKFGPNYKTKYKLKKPFHKVEEFPNMGFDPAEFDIFIRASSTDKPGLIGPDRGKVSDESQIYSGRYARFSVKPYAWEHATGGRGVSLGLHNVMLLRDAEAVGSTRISAEDEFSAVTLAPGQSADKLFSDNAA